MITKAGREAWASFMALTFAGMQSRLAEASRAVGLSPGAFRALMLLEHEQGIPMGGLAERWGCDASYMTTLADDLERAGYVRREPKPSDRRTRLLVLTADGAEAKQRAHDIFMQPAAELGALSGAEQRQLRDLLAKMFKAMPNPPFSHISGHQQA